MNQIAPGWYADPQDPQANQLRYWDGQSWTAHTQPRPSSAEQSQPDQSQPEQPQPEQPQPEQPQQPGQYGTPSYPSSPQSGQAQYPQAQYGGSQYGQPQYGGAQYGQAQYGQAQYGMPGVKTTPDGEELAGWGVRLGAWIIDALIVGVATAILAIPFGIYGIFFDFFEEAFDAGASGDAAPMSPVGDHFGRFALFGLASALLSAGYHIYFLVSRGATPGKQMLKLRVRLRDQPGNLSVGIASLRWFAQFWPQILGNVPILGGCLGPIYTLLDGLWPLWDDKNQALHDKIAKTNVVVRR